MPAPALGLRPRFAPAPTATVEPTHPLAAGLMTAQLARGGDLVDLTDRAPMTRTAFPTAGVTAFGAAQVNDDGNEGGTFTVGTTNPLALQPPVAFMWVGSKNASPHSDSWLWGVLYSTTDSSPYLSYGFQWAGDGSTIWMAGNDTSNAPDFYVHDVLGTVSQGPHVLIGMFAAGGGSVGYIDGVRATAAGIAGSISYGATSTLSVSNYIGTGRMSACSTNFATVWNRLISEPEAAALTADPFCFLRR